MLKYRVLTAAVLIPLVIWAIIALPLPWFGVLSGGLILGGAWEWSRLAGLQQRWARIGYVGLMLLVLLAACFIPISWLLTLGVAGWVSAIIWLIRYAKSGNGAVSPRVWRFLAGFWVLIPCWVGLNAIRSGMYGAADLLFLLVLIWGADTSAYFAGRAWGKRKLAPTISPGKTWAGVYAALISTVIIALVGGQILHFASTDWGYLVLVCWATVIASIFGDLFESMLKRQVAIKDSGNLLPGHGGILDRIDSLTAAAPVFAFCAIVFGFN